MDWNMVVVLPGGSTRCQALAGRCLDGSEVQILWPNKTRVAVDSSCGRHFFLVLRFLDVKCADLLKSILFEHLWFVFINPTTWNLYKLINMLQTCLVQTSYETRLNRYNFADLLAHPRVGKKNVGSLGFDGSFLFKRGSIGRLKMVRL